MVRSALRGSSFASFPQAGGPARTLFIGADRPGDSPNPGRIAAAGIRARRKPQRYGRGPPGVGALDRDAADLGGGPAAAAPPPESPPESSEVEPERLLAVLLGARGEGARSRASGLLADGGLAALSRRHPAELAASHGLTAAQAARVAAAFALGRVVERLGMPRRPAVSTPDLVYRLLSPELRGLDRETFHALLLDTRHRLAARVTVSEGTLTSSLVHPREVFGPALRRAAAAVVVAHNHPSGDPEPSAEDRAVTRRLVDAGKLLGVPLVDHVVIGVGAWVSLRERMPELAW